MIGRALGLLEIMFLKFYLVCTPALEAHRNGAAGLTKKTPHVDPGQDSTQAPPQSNGEG